jgi:parallel beta-helix repeat protein
MNSFFKTTLIAIFIWSCSGEAVTEGDWLSIEKDLQTQFITSSDSSTISIPEGNYMFTKGLLLDGKKHLTIRGEGAEKTILSFAMQEEGAEGLKISNCVNITLEDLTVEDAKGDNIKVTDTRELTIRNVISRWSGEPKEENGAYAFYPVLCKQVLIENCIARGASDAGIYVGQSDSVIIRNNIAYENVAGIESENSKWVEIYGNEAYDNTGGILIFDLPGLTQYGHTTRVYQNRVYENNYSNFAPAGNIVATVPPGTGIMLLATRNIEIFSNEISDNQTLGIAIASYDLVEAMETQDETQLNENIETARKDIDYDPYPNDVHIHDNLFENSYWFPSLKSDFGYLFLLKFPMATPDIVWDGIHPDRSTFNLCLANNGEINFGDLDAANDFSRLNTDAEVYNCRGITINPIF